MNRKLIVVGILLALVGLVWGIWFVGRPYLEPSVPFKTVAGSSKVFPRWPLDFWPAQTATAETYPALFVFGNPNDLDALISTAFRKDPGLAGFLGGVDYENQFVILALGGPSEYGFDFAIRQITWRGDRVTVWAEFVEAPGELTAVGGFLYHLVSVSKEGIQGQRVRFVLMDGYSQIAETTHAVP